jgi:lysophospholipase L1-like esterase
MQRPFRTAFVLIRGGWRSFRSIFSSSASFPGLPSALPNSLQRDSVRLGQSLDDWAQLGFYQQANAALAPANEGEQRIIFLGDSITEFWNLDTYFPNKPYINRGISGQTTPQLLIRLRPDVIALQPKVMVLLAGTNDIAGNTGPMTLRMIQDNYESITELAQMNHIRVIFGSVLPIHDYSFVQRSGDRPPEKILALNNWLRRYCLEHNHIYLDYYSSMVDGQGMLQAALADDGLHPNANGYAVMAPLAEAAIQQALQLESG